MTDPKSRFEVLDAPAEIQTYTQWVEWKSEHTEISGELISRQSYNVKKIKKP